MHVSLFIYKYFLFVDLPRIKRIKIFISCLKILKPLTFETIKSSQNFFPHLHYKFYIQVVDSTNKKEAWKGSNTQYQGWYESLEVY